MPRELPDFLVELLNRARKNRAAVNWEHEKAVKEEGHEKRAQVLATHSAALQEPHSHARPRPSHASHLTTASTSSSPSSTSLNGEEEGLEDRKSHSSSSSPLSRLPSSAQRPVREAKGKEEKAASSSTVPSSISNSLSASPPSSESSLPPCPQGIACTRQNASHRRHFSHLNAPRPRTSSSTSSSSSSHSASAARATSTRTASRAQSTVAPTDEESGRASRPQRGGSSAEEWTDLDDVAPVKSKKVPSQRKRRRIDEDEEDEEYQPTREEMKLAAEEEAEEEAELVKEEKEEATMPVDEEEEDGDEEVINAAKPRCAYWKNCYRTNPSHLAQFRHPITTAATRGRGQ